MSLNASDNEITSDTPTVSCLTENLYIVFSVDYWAGEDPKCSAFQTFKLCAVFFLIQRHTCSDNKLGLKVLQVVCLLMRVMVLTIKRLKNIEHMYCI